MHEHNNPFPFVVVAVVDVPWHSKENNCYSVHGIQRFVMVLIVIVIAIL